MYLNTAQLCLICCHTMTVAGLLVADKIQTNLLQWNFIMLPHLFHSFEHYFHLFMLPLYCIIHQLYRVVRSFHFPFVQCDTLILFNTKMFISKDDEICFWKSFGPILMTSCLSDLFLYLIEQGKLQRHMTSFVQYDCIFSSRHELLKFKSLFVFLLNPTFHNYTLCHFHVFSLSLH